MFRCVGQLLRKNPVVRYGANAAVILARAREERVFGVCRTSWPGPAATSYMNVVRLRDATSSVPERQLRSTLTGAHPQHFRPPLKGIPPSSSRPRLLDRRARPSSFPPSLPFASDSASAPLRLSPSARPLEALPLFLWPPRSGAQAPAAFCVWVSPVRWRRAVRQWLVARCAKLPSSNPRALPPSLKLLTPSALGRPNAPGSRLVARATPPVPSRHFPALGS
jgi:hypothetical protein